MECGCDRVDYTSQSAKRLPTHSVPLEKEGAVWQAQNIPHPNGTPPQIYIKPKGMKLRVKYRLVVQERDWKY